jgi:flagellar hook-associated protein 3 FlgL
MRVASNTFTNDLLDRLGSLATQQNRLQAQASTGQRISLPEDDPSATGRVLNLQAEAASVAQYQRNISRQQQLAQNTFTVMQSLKKVSDRASEIATLADGLKSPEELKTYATEVTQLIRQAAQLSNTKFDGIYLLSGTKTDQAAFTVTDAADGTVASVAYNGNAKLAETEIAEGVTVTGQNVGANTSGSGPRGLIADSRTGADLFAHLISLQNHLLSGDTASIASTDRGQLAKDEDSLIDHVAGNGAIQARLETASSVAKDRAQSLQNNVSGEADADLAQTLVKLNQSQTAYQAALQTGASVLKLSLMDYLR